MFDKNHSTTTKSKISNTRKGILKGFPKSDETKLKMSLARKAYWERQKTLA